MLSIITLILSYNQSDGPYRIIEKVSPVLYVLDFHNVQRKIHIIHLKLASNTSIHRRHLELILMREKRERKDDWN